MNPQNRRRLGAALLSLSLSLAATGAEAEERTPVAPPAQLRSQAPGYYRMAVGGFEVTALYDGYIDISPKLLKGASAKDIQSLLARMFLVATPGVQTAVNAYLVHTGKHLVLVDSGAAKCFGPTLGEVANNIRAAGYQPEQIDTILLTHLHPDHACGLIDADGKAVFANAELRVAKTEADFWLSEEVAAKAPKENQAYFKMARDAVAPYAAAGKFQTFAPGDSLLEGLNSVAAPGHTPGHTGYLFHSGAQSLLLWGDIVHSHATQFAHPEIAIEFDVNSAQAIATRKKLFAQAAQDKLWVGGAHLPFPGLGHVRADAKGYSWVPVEFSPLRSDR